ncbi:TIGR02253 family HAD-type hydrolase [Pyrococcus yayanosii]|uniref:Glyceraldehyde 3-phosphate phosphatase n=1 Tax=Pyrococcus yayanosii (strain CH1 / JCM 16557) TaxID=529709 RepID=F8AFL0_PYRYC|nr:TIGR02253 family HAD-type hydrolase [Pyrococcus yayanosii]AEH24976.1 hydrolase [Pyrococcus yayanosii CH1]
MVRVILFDIDGTLLSERPLVMLFLPQVYAEIARRMGVSRGEARRIFLREVERRHGTYEWHDWNFFFKLFGLSLRFEELLKKYPHKIEVFPGVQETLKQLSKEYKLGIVTSGPEYQRLKLRLAGLLEFFDAVVTRDDAHAIKPEPRIFLTALKALNAKPEETVMVGDSLEQDILGAKALGMRAVWVNREGEKGYNLPDAEIKTFSELPKVLGWLQ